MVAGWWSYGTRITDLYQQARWERLRSAVPADSRAPGNPAHGDDGAPHVLLAMEDSIDEKGLRRKFEPF